ncbi:MAG TPA: hypothetical protein VLF21_02605 [Candidatus Saccharimonadales bacterium]|nr:hypothetical protein [Candidatus Saccharimonadales bacterium]
MTIFERVKRLGLEPGKYAVFGSGLLDAWGLRKANDLDIVVTTPYFKELRKDPKWIDNPGNGFEKISYLDANVTTNQDTPTDGDYLPSRDEMIRKAVVINGVPFVRVEEVIACKKVMDRLKDQEDIRMINEYLKTHGPNPNT